jgi:amiloride-sensitive sodium channel
VSPFGQPLLQMRDCVIILIFFVKTIYFDKMCKFANVKIEQIHQIIFRQYLELADFALPYSNWSLDDGYSKNEKAFSYPVRVHMSGARHGLKLDILTSDGSPDGCGNSGQGYKVLLHSPMDIPNFDQEYFKVQLNQSVVVVVKPTMITTAESLKKFSAKRRGCFFQSERPLLYFKQYTLRNCKLECLTNYTFSLCGCVNFFMPS